MRFEAVVCRGLILCFLTWSCAKASPPTDSSTATSTAAAQPAANTVTSSTASKPPVVANRTDFSAYWRELRAALLGEDAEAVARLTSFPLTVRGELDDDPVREIDRAAFPHVLRRLLAQDVGLSPEPEALAQYVKRATEVPSGSVDGKTARIASMEFELQSEGWRLVGAYLGESE